MHNLYMLEALSRDHRDTLLAEAARRRLTTAAATGRARPALARRLAQAMRRTQTPPALVCGVCID
jgi:hypothetical protein